MCAACILSESNERTQPKVCSPTGTIAPLEVFVAKTKKYGCPAQSRPHPTEIPCLLLALLCADGTVYGESVWGGRFAEAETHLTRLHFFQMDTVLYQIWYTFRQLCVFAHTATPVASECGNRQGIKSNTVILVVGFE